MKAISTRKAVLLWMTVAVMASSSVFAQPRARVGSGFAPSLLLDAAEVPSSSLPVRAVAETGFVGRLNAQAMTAGRLRLDLPDGRSWVVKRTREALRPGSERTWMGEFEGQPGSLFVMTLNRGLLNGFMHHGSETWEIESSGAGRSRIYRVDEGRLPPEGPITNGPSDQRGSVSSSSLGVVATAAEPVTQDLLVLYTPAAATANSGADNLKSKTIAAIEAANTAYINSGVGIRLNLVGWQMVDYSETGDMGVSLSDLRGTTDGKMDDAHSLRNQLGADLVSLLTNETNYCGIAYLGSASGNSSLAFSVVSPNCFAGHTFAHEIGHNQGNHHDRVSASGSPAYPYSYGYRTCDYPSLANGQSFRTVMAYSCTSTPRVNFFSNPQIYFNNTAPMGISYEINTADAADNARSMNNTAAVIAGYRSGSALTTPAAPTGLAANSPAFDRVNLTWADNSNDESGFIVQRATGAAAYADIATLGAGVTSYTNTGLTGSTDYSYRVRAYNSAGSSVFSNVQSVTTLPVPPKPIAPAPASLTSSGLVVTVSWTNVADESGYELVRETYNARKNTWAASTTTVAADVSSLSQSLSAGTYRYKVRAYNAAGASADAIVSCQSANSANITNCNALSEGSFNLVSTSTKGPRR